MAAGIAMKTDEQIDERLDERCIATIRTLCIDAIQQADSGHPGTPIGIAPVTYTLWQKFLRFDPSDPIWPNRDRYVLSSGHASTLLWSMLHLTRVRAVDPDYEMLGQPAVSLDDLKHFRQLDSRAPGIPSTDGPAASRQRPARSAPARPRRWGWPWPASGSRPVTTATASRCSTSTSTRRPATAA
jgi:transketolase-like protein